jgi:hypothetical protein
MRCSVTALQFSEFATWKTESCAERQKYSHMGVFLPLAERYFAPRFKRLPEASVAVPGKIQTPMPRCLQLGGAALQMQSSSTARCRRFSLGIQRVARFLLTQTAAL